MRCTCVCGGVFDLIGRRTRAWFGEDDHVGVDRNSKAPPKGQLA